MLRWQRWTLLLIVLGAVGLAVRWAFLVPIYQSPDEPLHLDYALCLHAHGGLFRAADSPPPRLRNRGENVYTHEYIHPYTNYLMDQSGAGPIVFNVPAKVAPDYGSAAFFERLDADAVPWETIEVHEAPALYRTYPFGYYALLAGWLECLHRVDASLSFIFFGARLLSVLMLAGTLLLSYGTLRTLHLSRAASLLLTAGVGFFPLTSFVASYVQPDNLSLLLASACFYLSLQVRRRPGRWINHACLGMVMGGLLVTKMHYFVAVALPIAGLLAGELCWSPMSRFRRAGAVCCLLLPSVATGLLYAWTQRGVPQAYQPPAVTVHPLWNIIVWGRKAFSDYYLGMTHKSFWGLFGWLDTPLVFHDEFTSKVIRALLVAVGVLLLVLTLARGGQVARTLWRLAWRGHRRWAWRVAFSNPLVNSYFLFTALMFVVYIRLHNSFGGQGRNWLPLLLPFFLTGFVYVPKLFRRRQHRRACAAAVLAGLLVFDGVGSCYALASLSRRYYAPYHGQPVEIISAFGERGRRSKFEIRNSKFEIRAPTPLAIKLPAPRFVHGLMLRYVFTHQAGQQSRVYVTWTGPSGSTTVMLHMIPDECVHTITVPVESVIEQVSLETEMGPSLFDLRAVNLLCPVTAAQ